MAAAAHASACTRHCLACAASDAVQHTSPVRHRIMLMRWSQCARMQRRCRCPTRHSHTIAWLTRAQAPQCGAAHARSLRPRVQQAHRQGHAHAHACCGEAAHAQATICDCQALPTSRRTRAHTHARMPCFLSSARSASARAMASAPPSRSRCSRHASTPLPPAAGAARPAACACIPHCVSLQPIIAPSTPKRGSRHDAALQSRSLGRLTARQPCCSV